MHPVHNLPRDVNGLHSIIKILRNIAFMVELQDKKPHSMPTYQLLKMLCNGRFPCVPLVACIPVFFNSGLQVPLCFPNIHLTTLAGDLVEYTCQAPPLVMWIIGDVSVCTHTPYICKLTAFSFSVTHVCSSHSICIGKNGK